MNPEREQPHHSDAASPAGGAVVPADDGVFAPDSMMWKVVRHRAILLHGPAAAVLQIAHPRIGLGVMEHSRFEAAPLGRLQRTLDAVYAIAFGTRAQADAAARRIARRHAAVTGDAAAHGLPGAARYTAGEIDLLMWVIATLVWSAVSGYERSVGRLTADEKDRFYQDMRTLGTFFGLPAEHGPQTYDEYLDYFENQVSDEQLGSHPVSRRVAWAVARPRTPWWLRLAGPPITFVFSEILPVRVRDRLGFRSTVVSRASLAITTAGLRLFARLAPRPLRHVREYREALAALEPDRSSRGDACTPLDVQRRSRRRGDRGLAAAPQRDAGVASPKVS